MHAVAIKPTEKHLRVQRFLTMTKLWAIQLKHVPHSFHMNETVMNYIDHIFFSLSKEPTNHKHIFNMYILNCPFK